MKSNVHDVVVLSAALILGTTLTGHAAPPGQSPPGQTRSVEIISPLTPDGNVAVEGSVAISNLPALQDVFVTNSSASPVPVLVQNPAPEAAAIYRYNMFCHNGDFAGDPGCNVGAIPIPAGRTLLLTDVVAALFGDSSMRIVLCDDALADPCPLDRRLALQLSSDGPETRSISLGPGMLVNGGSIRIQEDTIFDGGADITFYGLLR